MDRGNSIFLVKWCLFVIIIFISNDFGVNLEQKNSFIGYWYSAPRSYKRVISITKHLGGLLKIIIDTSSTENDKCRLTNLLTDRTNYFLEGFNFIDNIIKNKENDHPDLMERILSTSSYGSSAKKFLTIIETIEEIFKHDFRHIYMYNDEHLEAFYNKTIKNPEFRTSIMLTDFLYSSHPRDQLHKVQPDKHIFHMYFDGLQLDLGHQEICGSTVTQLLYDFYERVLIDVTKAYTMIIVGYEFYCQKNAGYAIQTIKNSYYDKFLETIKNVLYSANGMYALITLHHRTLKNCNPAEWKEGVNYIRVKNYVSDRSGFIAKDNRDFKSLIDMNQENECNNFALYSNFRSESVDSLRCPEVFEIDSNCSSLANQEFTMIGKNYPRFWHVACYDKTSYKSIFNELCYCDRHSDTFLSIRKLSLKGFYTDALDTRVVTGIRFAVKNKVISLEIQEGKLVNDTIDPDSLRWITDGHHDPETGPTTIKLGFKVKSFNLDNIELPAGYFVTGVRFELVEENHISLAVRGSYMWNDISTLSSTFHQWFRPDDNPKELREKIEIRDYKNSAEMNYGNEEISHPGGNFVSLSVGVVSEKYNNLPVIPFFDSQSLETHPPAPIGGLGLFYKSRPEFGGFLAFKLFSSRFSYNFYSDMIHFSD